MSESESDVSSADVQQAYDETEESIADDDAERTAIRAQLATMSFEELQQLKERVGARVYREAMFGQKRQPEQKVFKRANKNRPMEMSAKIPVRMVPSNVTVKKKPTEVRDPRFDPLCGQLDKKQFSQDYSFVNELRAQDAKAVRAELRGCTEPERAAQLRRLLQRLAAQLKQGTRRPDDKPAKVVEKLPANKGAGRVSSLVQQYEELRQQGAARVQRHLNRRKAKILKRTPRAPT